MNCEQCGESEGYFVKVWKAGTYTRDYDIERDYVNEKYYCIDCFKLLILKIE